MIETSVKRLGPVSVGRLIGGKHCVKADRPTPARLIKVAIHQ